ncbi:hypothetical protein Cni_G27230 [Canna indica]|uniref:Uncharacterized protein n=1 Tax=Canna indica TaxID=4628 RepID=A0AAQ3QRZ1_9LILI|nr:hypothetical protein Cni_G27230 [Canna indica]
MAKEKAAAFTGRAWRLLRLALLWARKGGALKRGIFVDLRVKPGYLKSLKLPGGRRADRLRFGEREFSFEETPAFHFKTPPMRLHLRIPCITPAAADFDYDGLDDLVFAERDTYCGYSIDDIADDSTSIADQRELEDGVEEEEEEVGIDRKAEKFIEKFYEQMKMQRQISWIQYNEMLLRGVN